MEAFSRLFPKKGRLSPEKGFFSALREEIARYFSPILPAGRAEIHLFRISLERVRSIPGFAMLKYGTIPGRRWFLRYGNSLLLGFFGKSPECFPASPYGNTEFSPGRRWFLRYGNSLLLGFFEKSPGRFPTPPWGYMKHSGAFHERSSVSAVRGRYADPGMGIQSF